MRWMQISLCGCHIKMRSRVIFVPWERKVCREQVTRERDETHEIEKQCDIVVIAPKRLAAEFVSSASFKGSNAYQNR